MAVKCVNAPSFGNRGNAVTVSQPTPEKFYGVFSLFLTYLRSTYSLLSKAMLFTSLYLLVGVAEGSRLLRDVCVNGKASSASAVED